MRCSSRNIFRIFLIAFCVCFICILIIGFKGLFDSSERYSYNDFIFDDHIVAGQVLPDRLSQSLNVTAIEEPIIIWWTPFTQEPGTYTKCGNVTCFFTMDRKYLENPLATTFLFYGSDFQSDDLPLPRRENHTWGLLHEESPKNNYLFSFEEILSLFNYTSTFRRESSYPLTTQYLSSLDDLLDNKYMVSVEAKNEHQKMLAPIFYAHSDCDTVSDRDSYVKALMEYIPVDSYGKCLHNKDLPQHLKDPLQGMEHKDMYQLVAKYKFSLAMENGICNDYVTEKLWRPLKAGSIPIVLGPPNVKDFLPSNVSALVVDDFNSVQELAKYIEYLNGNDEDYQKYLDWKKSGITNPVLSTIIKNRPWVANADYEGGSAINFISGFECYVCQKVHENLHRQRLKKPPVNHRATINHYGCPKPKKFNEIGQRVDDEEWASDWIFGKYRAKALRFFLDNDKWYTRKDLLNLAMKYYGEETNARESAV